MKRIIKRILITIDSKTLSLLKKAKKETGMSISELVRRAVRDYLIARGFVKIEDKTRKELFRYLKQEINKEAEKE